MHKGGWRSKHWRRPRTALLRPLEAKSAHGTPSPGPSLALGRTMFPLPALTATKISPYGAMRAQGVGNTALAVRLGLSEGVVHRLIDFNQHSPSIHTSIRSIRRSTRSGSDWRSMREQSRPDLATTRRVATLDNWEQTQLKPAAFETS